MDLIIKCLCMCLYMQYVGVSTSVHVLNVNVWSIREMLAMCVDDNASMSANLLCGYAKHNVNVYVCP